jgi:4-oxalocrotonate tautomerase
VPLVDVTLTEGRSPEQVRDLLHAVHDAVHRTTGARSEHIRVIVREVPRTHWATGDVTVAEMDLPAPDRAAGPRTPKEQNP